MKKCFSLFLILAFILSPISQILANEKENEDDLRGIFGDKEEESEVVILNSSRERILNDFFELQDKVNKELTAESFQRLKNSAQRILNTPAIDWESASSSFLISEFENSLSQDFKKFGKLNVQQRVFWDKNSEALETFSLISKEKVFWEFQETLKAFKKMQILAHEKDEHKDLSLFDSFNLELNDIGKKDFDQFVSRQNYHVVGSKIIPRLSEDMDIEQEALGEIPDEIHWKNLLRRAAIDLYINRWVHLDSLWMRERFPVGQRVSILPLFCQNHYFSIHPLSIPSLLEERKNVPSRALLDAQFYMKLSSDPEIVIPVLASDLLSQKLIGMIPAWKGEYEVLEKVSSEMSQELIHNLTFTLQSMENLFARYGLSWVFQQYSQKNIFQNILKAKKLLLSVSIERILVDSGAEVMPDTQEKLLALVEETVRDHQDDFLELSTKITKHHETAAQQVKEVEQMVADQMNPKVSAQRLLEHALDMSKKISKQDQRIRDLKNGLKLSPVEDTPDNFRLATLVFAGDLREAFSKDSFDEIEKILFPSEGSTYDAAYHRYQEWLKTFEGEAQTKKDVIRVAQTLGLDHYQFLASLFVDPKKRIQFEEIMKARYLAQEPILDTEIKYMGSKAPLYQQLLLAQDNRESEDILIDLVQRAVWDLKTKVEYELDRFCQLDLNSEEGMKFLLANSFFRYAAFSRVSDSQGFSKINDDMIHTFQEQVSHQGTFHNAVGYGFLTIIGLSFLSGPMSRLPRWLGGRFMPRVPHGILKVSEVFGIGAAPFAMWWMAQDSKRLFWDEGYSVEALEHWYDTQSEGSDQTATVVDVLKAHHDSQDPKNPGREIRDIIKSRLELRITQGSFLLFAPIQIAFVKGMLNFGYGMYSQYLPLTRRVGITSALGKLSVPTRFWTFKPGNELLMLSGGELKAAYLNAVDRSMTVPQLKKYVEKWIFLLKRQLSFHEANFGKAATWDQTKLVLKNNTKRVQERQLLVVQLKLYEEALLVLKESPVAKVSELAFKDRFKDVMVNLEVFYFAENLDRLYPRDELVWLMANIRTEKFFNHWFGGWVGWHGPLGRALQKMQAYQYLLSQREPLLMSLFR